MKKQPVWKTVIVNGITVAGGYECPKCKVIQPYIKCRICSDNNNEEE